MASRQPQYRGHLSVGTVRFLGFLDDRPEHNSLGEWHIGAQGIPVGPSLLVNSFG